MKKILWLFLLLMPFYVFAYSKYVIPGGETLGIEVNSKGVVIVGFYEINGAYINKELRLGDKILKVNNIVVKGTKELSDLINQYRDNNAVDITYVRNNKEINTKLNLVLQNGIYKTGLYVKGSILGIGTLTYIDPNNGVYGLLGHSLNFSQVNQKIDINTGYTYDAKVTSFTRSINGNPGSKNADIFKEKLFGNIKHNSEYGVFGIVQNNKNNELLEVVDLNEVRLGKAYIRTTSVNDEIEDYEIKIIDIDKSNTDKNIYFEIKDKNLLRMSGGIVQGMSGSPIIQDDKIIGAVTRVVVDDVDNGYGISIIKMLEEGDKLLMKE